MKNLNYKRIYGIILAIIFTPTLIGIIKGIDKIYCFHISKNYFWDGFLSVLIFEGVFVAVLGIICLIIWLIFD